MAAAARPGTSSCESRRISQLFSSLVLLFSLYHFIPAPLSSFSSSFPTRHSHWHRPRSASGIEWTVTVANTTLPENQVPVRAACCIFPPSHAVLNVPSDNLPSQAVATSPPRPPSAVYPCPCPALPSTLLGFVVTGRRQRHLRRQHIRSHSRGRRSPPRWWRTTGSSVPSSRQDLESNLLFIPNLMISSRKNRQMLV
jgi:hypothetical protein